MRKLLSLATVALIGFASTTQAATLDFNLGNSDDLFTFVGSGPALTPNITLSQTPPIVTGATSLVLYNSQIVTPPPVAGTYAVPSSPVGLFGGTFLSVYGPNNIPLDRSSPGMATLTLLPNQNDLGFTWGSIDTYNTLTLTDSAGHIFHITGNYLTTNSSTLFPGGFTGGSTSGDFNFYDPNGFIEQAVFSSTDNSFEVANLGGHDAAPLPGSVLLFGTALVGFVFFAARRRAQSKI
jgi:hypothetical protein